MNNNKFKKIILEEINNNEIIYETEILLHTKIKVKLIVDNSFQDIMDNNKPHIDIIYLNKEKVESEFKNQIKEAVIEKTGINIITHTGSLLSFQVPDEMY